MSGLFRFTVRFSGISVAFCLPSPIVLPEHFSALEGEPDAKADDTYNVVLLEEPLTPPGEMAASVSEARIFQTEKGWLHIYPALGDGKGCQVACLFCSDGFHTLYYPASRWQEYSRIWCCTHLLCPEQLLLRHDAILLHSALVMLEGKAILFCGASGAGKSTQAELWHRHLGADILNGDRTVIRKTSDGFTGGGSLWSGTSGIYRREYAPIAGIFLVEHGPRNRIDPLGFDAFKPLLTQTLTNSWDEAFMAKAVGLISDLMDQIPVYRLSCRPEKEAAELAYQVLFKRGT